MKHIHHDFDLSFLTAVGADEKKNPSLGNLNNFHLFQFCSHNYYPMALLKLLKFPIFIIVKLNNSKA